MSICTFQQTSLLLLQLAYVSERDGGGPKALESSSAAHTLLMTLGTDPSHGMLPALVGRDDKGASDEGEEEQQKPAAHTGQLLIL